MPLTLHETVVSVAPVTVAAKLCVFPKRSETVAGVMVTVIEEGVGGGGGRRDYHGACACASAAPGAAHGACSRGEKSENGQRGKARLLCVVRIGAGVLREGPHAAAKCRRRARGNERGVMWEPVCPRGEGAAVSCSNWEC